MIIVNLQQGSEEWFQEKLGKPSASNASRIITNEGKPSKQREDYLYSLAGEILTGKREEGFKNGNTENGSEREEESRSFFELTQGVEIEQVGVIYKDEQKKFLCSPDGIRQAGKFGLEMKNPIAKTQVEYLLANQLPAKYFSQVQMSLYITGFKFWYFLSYVPAMRSLILKIEPDKAFQKALDTELNKFCTELEEIVKKLS